ncbi:hypothetical protein Q3V30_22625 (plasmid) [Erwinia pyri]|uniref:Uncharacterized protein n=1 Tax=Erwinia pyri TaxID=3062598 RepID=A0AA50HSQ8_9GAMM|nr:hypothetical protein [Erwinia sp. DE2]WLS81260.1 hypothetical protein Q3V30_22625 [Erwinia sp. DE2]
MSRDTHGQGDATQVMAELVAEMRALREEVAGLKAELQEVRRLEHKPEQEPVQEQPEPSPITQQVTLRTWWQRFWE